MELINGTYELGLGDTIYFVGPSLRSPKAIGDQTTRLIAVVTPPVL